MQRQAWRAEAEVVTEVAIREATTAVAAQMAAEDFLVRAVAVKVVVVMATAVRNRLGS